MKFLIHFPIVCIISILTLKTYHFNSNFSSSKPEEDLISPEGQTILSRIKTPEGFERTVLSQNSFGQYLRKLPLKKAGSKVLLFNGNTKIAQVHAAVVSMDIGNKNLQQCADACIRLRAEYLFSQKRYDEIHFNFTNGFKAEYTKWRNGFRINVNGNQCVWKKTTNPDTSYSCFRKYLDQVFSYAGTLSLSKEMKTVSLQNVKIGDVFIQGGSPGHAVIVVDLALNQKTGKKVFLLAQSYMPAQEIHILNNLNNSTLSPWFALEDNSPLYTPEWNFPMGSLKSF